jgi:hypothetical protein
MGAGPWAQGLECRAAGPGPAVRRTGRVTVQGRSSQRAVIDIEESGHLAHEIVEVRIDGVDRALREFRG